MPISTRYRTKLGCSSNMENINFPNQKYPKENENDEPPLLKKRKNQSKQNKENSNRSAADDGNKSRTVTINQDGDISTESNETSSSKKSNDSQMLTLKSHHIQLKKVLSKEYVDIINRLQLNFMPNCVRDMVFCKNNHSKQCPKPSGTNPNINIKSNHLISENRAFSFLKKVDHMCNCNRTFFMDSEVLSSIFQLILTFNPTDDHFYTSDYIINECSLIFDKLITTFPPCWQEINKNYDIFLTSSINTSKFIAEKTESNAKNIFVFIITLFEETINLKNDKYCSLSVHNETESDFFNFHEWESRHSKKHNFDLYTRDEKLERLFLTLHLITKLLELDLSLWMLRYLSKPSKHIFANEKPLIVKVFEMNEFIQITDTVKKILNLFVICVSFGYPEKKTDILSRLLSLLSVVINLTETESTPHGVIYPKIGTKTDVFSKEIIKTMENCVGVSIEKYLLVIENIKIPFIKYLIIDNLLIKLNPHSGLMCPKKIFENFTKRWWTHCAPAPIELIQDNGKVLRPINHKETSSTNKYPIIENIQNKTKSSEIYREEYLQLLLEALKSYCDVYATKKFALILMNQNDENISLNKVTKKSNIKRSASPVSVKLNLEKLEKDILKLMKKVNYQEENVYTENELPIYDNVFIDSDTMIKYNEDIKYMMRLKKNIPLMKENFGNEFNNWDNYINQFFSVDRNE